MDDFVSFATERERFATFVFDLVNQDTAVFYRGKKKYPIDQGFARILCFLSFVFYDASFRRKPTLPEIGLFLERNGDIAPLYSDACYWYERWAALMEEERCASFCDELNKLLLRKAKKATSSPWILLPDLRARREDIRRKVHAKMLSEEKR